MEWCIVRAGWLSSLFAGEEVVQSWWWTEKDGQIDEAYDSEIRSKRCGGCVCFCSWLGICGFGYICMMSRLNPRTVISWLNWSVSVLELKLEL